MYTHSKQKRPPTRLSHSLLSPPPPFVTVSAPPQDKHINALEHQKPQADNNTAQNEPHPKILRFRRSACEGDRRATTRAVSCPAGIIHGIGQNATDWLA